MQQYPILWMLLSASLVTPMAQANEALHLDEVDVRGHYDNAIGIADAASEGTVNAALIKNRPTLRTGEILEFVPGMIATQHSGSGKANQFYLRGFNLDHGTDFATYVDDMPVNMRTHAHGQGYTDLNFLIPELVSHIHYKKGPYSAEEGDFSSAGAARLHLVNQLPQGIASLTIGSYDYQRMLLANSVPLADGHLLYALDMNHYDGPWQVAEGVRKYNGLLRYSEGDAHDSTTLTAMAYRNRWNSTDQIPRRAVQSGQISRFDAIDPSDGGDSSRYSLSFNKQHRDQQGSWQMSAYAVRSELDLYSNFTYFLNDPVNGDQFNQSEKRTMLGVNLSKSWLGELAGLPMENNLGIQTRYDKLSPVALYNTVNTQRISLIRSDKVEESSAGLFAENTVWWHEKLRTVVGVRYDRYQFDVKSSINGNSGNTSDGITSPKLSVIVGPWANTEFFYNIGKGFHSNDARGTTQTRLADGSAASPVTPLVSTRGSEVGVRTEWVPGLQSSLVVWQLDIDSELVFVGDAGETEPSRASRRTGIEWNNHYVVNDWLLLDMDLALSKARFTKEDPAEPGRYIPGSINKVASLGATVTNWGNWFGSMQLRYFGPRALVADNSVRSNATLLTYARLGYRYNPRTTLTLDVFNLFDRKASDIDYYYESQLAGEATPVNDKHFHPVEPRSARLALTYNF
ncbi:TonB-dependent receptor [Methylophilus aquaticus]|uniref:TonB-dependent receptor n=2 Tax=Methylophilus aquaticus TaxID=1971610 RepID=A0ABT9JPE6_9PROT|nr:TonB-dependent receptor [Methylophilus aquaticus]MDP8566429.1 TonB-dependent receptor [Methylophilus aquaticus]